MLIKKGILRHFRSVDRGCHWIEVTFQRLFAKIVIQHRFVPDCGVLYKYQLNRRVTRAL